MGKKRNITPLGERIKRKRLDAGLSQIEVAKKIGISQATVSNWEIGKLNPTDTELTKLGDIIGKVYRPQVNAETGQPKNKEPESNEESQSDESPFSVWLRTNRLKKGFSIPELASKANVTPPTLYAIEAGKISNPQEKTQKKIEKALGVDVSQEVVDETEKDALVEGFGQLVGFDPHDFSELPACPGVYVLYDISERPIYVGEGGNIKTRIKDHEQKFWFKAPIVETGAYIKIEKPGLRNGIETLLIKFLKSNAVLNKQKVER